jgi:hypothetical protein
MLNQKIESSDATNLVFVFVRLNHLDSPEYYVVPRADVSRFSAENHKLWLATPGRKGQQHNDSPLRQFKDPSNQYRDRWDLLGLDGDA